MIHQVKSSEYSTSAISYAGLLILTDVVLSVLPVFTVHKRPGRVQTMSYLCSRVGPHTPFLFIELAERGTPWQFIRPVTAGNA